MKEIVAKDNLIYVILFFIAIGLHASNSVSNSVGLFDVFYSSYIITTNIYFMIFFTCLLAFNFYRNNNKEVAKELDSIEISDKVVKTMLKFMVLMIVVFVSSEMLSSPFEYAIDLIEGAGDDTIGWYTFSEISGSIYEYKSAIFDGEIYLSMNWSFPSISVLSMFILMLAVKMTYDAIRSLIVKKV